METVNTTATNWAKRRARFELSQIEHERDRVEHQRTMLQLELAPIVRRPGSRGCNEPAALPLVAEIRELDRQLDVFADKIRAAKAELYGMKQ
jgi:hypothetical protein